MAEFTKRGQCVVDQFEGYFVEPGIHHQGKLVLARASAISAGQPRVPRVPEGAARSRRADDRRFTPDQQFFIAWGQWRGDAVRPEFARLMVQATRTRSASTA